MRFSCTRLGRRVPRNNASACVPGCGDPPEWCLPGDEGACGCNFDNKCRGRLRPWKPAQLGWLLNTHAESGARARGINTWTGYAEVVVDAERTFASPAAAVEAFFYSDSGHYGPNGRASVDESAQRVCKVRRAFLGALRLDPCQVPVLRLRIGNWTEPFEAHQCA